MSEEKHKEMVIGFWGKVISVIAIPFVVYYCTSHTQDKKEKPLPIKPEINIPDSPSQHELNIRRSHELITRGHETLTDSTSY